MFLSTIIISCISFPDRTTVSRNVEREAAVERELLRKELKDALSEGPIGLTCDMWTDPHKNHPFITITGHFIRDWKLHNRIICTSEFDPLLSKTGMCNLRDDQHYGYLYTVQLLMLLAYFILMTP